MQSLHQVVTDWLRVRRVLSALGLPRDGKALNSPAVHLRPWRGGQEQGRRGAQRTAPKGRTGDRGAGRGAGGRGARSLISALSAAGRLHGARLAAGSYRRGACAFEWTLCTVALVLLHRELPWSRPNLCGAPVPNHAPSNTRSCSPPPHLSPSPPPANTPGPTIADAPVRITPRPAPPHARRGAGHGVCFGRERGEELPHHDAGELGPSDAAGRLLHRM